MTMETPDTDAAEMAAWTARAHTNLARMKQMRVTPHEQNRIVGFLAGTQAIELALDAVEADRKRAALERDRRRRPIKGQTVIPMASTLSDSPAVA